MGWKVSYDGEMDWMHGDELNKHGEFNAILNYKMLLVLSRNRLFVSTLVLQKRV